MVKVTDILYYAINPQELRSIIQWKVWHQPVHEREEDKESVSSRICYDFLDKTSRSFSAVIQELHPELLLPICLFYLILRGLDTIEDDTSIPAETKNPLLRDFHDRLEEDGWCFTGNRPEEKDRELLVQFKHVVTEFKKIKPAYRDIIKDTTDKMGNGMADYINNAEFNEVGVDKIEDYELYCHYVAGLVGEGLTRLFVESGYGNPALLQKSHLHESMGRFLQKTNIIRDIKEDFDDKRKFWPREIWSKHVDKYEDLLKPEYRDAALNCSSEMVLNALNHADECLFYLAGLKEQSVFNFCAIPQSMAIATLALCFRNPKIFERNIKITRGQACQIMVASTQNLRIVCEVFRDHVRLIHKKNVPQDPSFLKISIACGKIEQFIESIFPSQRPEDVIRSKPGEPKTLKALEKEAQDKEARHDMLMMMMAMGTMLLVVSGLMFGLAWLLGARFDLAFADAKKGMQDIMASNWRPAPGSSRAAKPAKQFDHDEI
ncbi:Delta(24)-sterol C-methyltransferase [Endocarpon pusillum]|uniref:Squalene synthase n=1 Tax=Endocarpon pusillum TaxID=364733 RepID=A0A8H7AII6_9EURO|nr:Delta(24)-sterol C-methyltransferase [Endocarpon pusillum]